MGRVLKWEDPPPVNYRSSSWMAPVIAELQAHPGVWALVRVHNRAHQTNASTDAVLFRKRGCDAHSRTVADECRVYARWPED